MLNQTPNSSNLNLLSNERMFYSTPMKSVPESLLFNKSESKYYNSAQKYKKIGITNISDTEKISINNIDEILKLFINNFPNHSTDYIIDCLKRNSFNLEDTYLQLSKPNEFEGNNIEYLFFFYFI